MPPKTKQHTVPRVYLKAFCDPAPPPDWPPERPHEPAVWTLDKSLEHPARRKAPKGILWSPRAYNLREDAPENPVLEERLSELEGEYARVLPKLVARQDLDQRDWIILLVFVGTLRGRSLEHLAFRQEQIDHVQHLYRQVDRASTGSEEHSNQFWAGADEGAKRTVLGEAGTYAHVIEEAGAWLIANDSALPFITSDQPVAHEFMHIDELAAMGFPPDRWRPGVLPNQRGFFSFCALTPRLALVASPLLAPAPEVYWSTHSQHLVGTLNLLTRHRAKSTLIADTPQPFGPNQQRLLDYEAWLRTRPRDTRPTLEVYTDEARFRFRLESYVVEPAVFDSKIRFATRDLEQLRRLASARRITEIALEDGKSETHMRDMVLLSVALAPDAESVLVQELP